jgi:hypothetical protein
MLGKQRMENDQEKPDSRMQFSRHIWIDGNFSGGRNARSSMLFAPAVHWS